MPPPAAKTSAPPASRARRQLRPGESGVATKTDMAAATVDEVTADLSKDPRSERDDDEEG
jgi:hypothetical protein